MATAVVFNGTSYSIPAAGEVAWASLSNFLIAVANNAQTTTKQIGAIRTATSTPVTVSAATDFCVVVNLAVAGATAVTLPTGTNGQRFIIVDGKGDAATNNITVSGTAQNIRGAATYVINSNYGAIVLQFSTTEGQWEVVSEALSTVPISKGGTGNVTANAAFNALAPMTTKGDIAAFNGTINVRLPVGTNGQVLSADSSTATGLKYADALTNPLTTTGDILYSSSGTTPGRLAAGADNTVLAGTGVGAAPAYQQIDSPSFFAAGAEASNAARGVLSTGAQNIAGLKTFYDGVRLDDDTAAGGMTTLAYYREELHSTTFTFNGTGSPGTSGSIAIRLTRVGRVVTYFMPQVQATTGTNSGEFDSNTDLPAWARPILTTNFSVYITNGSTTEEMGVLEIGDTGNIRIQRADSVNFTNSAAAGTFLACCVSYVV